MLRLLPLLIGAAAAWAQPQAVDVLAKVRDTYSHLQAIHVIASLSDSEMLLATRTVVNSQEEYEFAVRGPGSFRAWTKNKNTEALAVSDGSSTWKVLPKLKQWMKQEVGSSMGDGREQGNAKVPQDFPHFVSSTLVSRYPAIARQAEAPEIVRDDSYRLKNTRIPCYVLKARIEDQQYELWIDKARYLILRDVQRGTQQTRVGRAMITIEIKVQEIETNGDVSDSLFSLAPNREWAEVEMLTLPNEKPASLAGRPAIDFTLKSIDGELVRLNNLRGKVVVLDFWATWCGPCRQELPVLEKLRAEFGNSVQFFGVNDEEAATVRGFRKSKGFEMPVLMDVKRDVNNQYGIRAIPTLLVINAQGIVRQQWVGTRSERDLRKAIQDAASER